MPTDVVDWWRELGQGSSTKYLAPDEEKLISYCDKRENSPSPGASPGASPGPTPSAPSLLQPVSHPSPPPSSAGKRRMTAPDTRKKSYTLTCSSKFRDAVLDLARRRRTNVADLARSVVLMVVPGVIAAHPDPGEPDPGDREAVILKSGPAMGRPWRRKPRLQVRMTPGLAMPQIRRALALALAIDRGEMDLRLEGSRDGKERRAKQELPDSMLLRETREELERLRAIVSVLSFEPISGGIATLEDALHILGFPPASRPPKKLIRDRFRMLATIHHPDSSMGSHQRMSQLNAAMEILRVYAA